MPLYDFQCWHCDHVFEARQAMVPDQRTHDPLRCPKCGYGPPRRLIGASAVALRGGGWAKDGYSSKPTTKEGG